MPAYNHEYLFIPAKQVIPATTNIGPRNLALEGRNQDGSVITLRHNEVHGGAVRLQVIVRCGCSHSGRARSQRAGRGKSKAHCDVNLTPTEEKATAKKMQAFNFKREEQSADEEQVN